MRFTMRFTMRTVVLVVPVFASLMTTSCLIIKSTFFNQSFQ